MTSQDVVYHPGQVLAKPTWIADMGCGAIQVNGLDKILVVPSVWPRTISSVFMTAKIHILFCSVWPITTICSFRPGEYPHFCLFGLVNDHSSVCSVCPTPLYQSVRFGEYPHFGLLAWPIPTFWSVGSGQNQQVCVFGLVDTLNSVCWVWSKSTFWSVRSGQCPHFCLFGLANNHILVGSVSLS